MATNYPGALDSLTNPAAGDALTSPSHSAQHANANDAIEAVQTELGTTPSGSESTVAARLDKIEDGTRLGTNSVGASELADNAVDTAAIADSAVTSAKIADGTITSTDVAAGTFAAFGTVGNLLTANQASVETDTTGFYAGGDATLSRSTSYAAHGAASLAATSNSAADYGINVGSPGALWSMPPVSPGSAYTFIVSIRCSTARTFVCRIYWRDSGGGAVSTAAGTAATVGSSDFTPFTMTAVAPAGAAYAIMEVVSTVGAAGAGEVAYFDALSFHRGAGGQWAMPGTPITGLSHIATNNAVHLSGTGAPEGVVTAAPSSTWLQTDSTTDVKGWIRWVKASGTGNTGWVAGPEADTGPRVVTVDGAGWSGALLLRRIGRQVQVYTDSTNVPIMPASGTQIMTLPAGFTAALGTYPGVAYNLWTGATVGVRVTGTNNLSVAVAGDLLATRGLAPLLTFISPADWPTSLPGVAP